MMPAWFTQLEQRVNALSTRERVVMFVMGVVLIIGAADQVWLDKRFQVMTKHIQEIETARHAILRAQAEVATLSGQLQEDPNTAARKEIEALILRRQELAREVANASGHFISPGNMSAVLGTLLRERSGLELLGMKLLPVQEVRLGEAEQSVTLYEHRLEVKLRGSFMSVRDYLQAIEKMEKRVVWESLHFSVKKHPMGEIELIVKTLGTSKEFIGVYH